MEALSANVRGKAKQYERLVAILWDCYLSSRRHTQLEVAALLGVSDSLVSQCRRRIEQELRALSFAGIAEARDFEEALKEHVSRLLRDSPAKRPDPLQRSPERAAEICEAVLKGAPGGSSFGSVEKTAQGRRRARVNQ